MLEVDRPYHRGWFVNDRNDEDINHELAIYTAPAGEVFCYLAGIQ